VAVPKKKTSVSRKGKRHAGQHHKLYAKNPMKCPNCAALTLHGHACPSCGTYKGREVFTIKVREDEDQDEGQE
jgi:large subunit ribosomal protein L32